MTEYLLFAFACWFLAAMGWCLIRALEDTDDM